MRKLLLVAVLLVLALGTVACSGRWSDPCKDPCDTPCNPCNQPNPCASPCSPCG